MNKKQLILLALAANAHVHGADNTSNKCDNKTLGKRAHSDREVDHGPTKRQKIDQTAVKNFTTSRVFSVPTQYLTVPEALKMGVLSKNTRTKLEGLLPKTYNNETQKWEEARVVGNLDEYFGRFRTSLFVPRIPNTIQGVPDIIGDKRVDRITIGRLAPNPRPEGLGIINDLFTDRDPNNNNSLTVKVVPPNNRDVRWNMGGFLPNVSHVKHLIYEGKTGNERLDTVVPGDVDNKCVTIRNFRNFRLNKNRYTINMDGQDCEVILERDNIGLTSSEGNIKLTKEHPLAIDEFYTKVRGLNAQMTVNNETIMARSDNGRVDHRDYTEFAVTNTEASGLNPQVTVALGTIEGLRPINARSDTNVMHKDIWGGEEDEWSDDYLNSISKAAGPNSTIRTQGVNSITIEGGTKVERTEYNNGDDHGGYNIPQFEFKAEGIEGAGIEQAKPQIIIDDNGRTMIISNRDACCISYEEGNIGSRTEAYGTTNAKVTLYEEEGGVTGEADRVVCHEEYHKNGKLYSETTAHATHATPATVSSVDGKIEGKGGNGVTHKDFWGGDEGAPVSYDYLNSISIAEGPNSTIRKQGVNSITIEGGTKVERTEYNNGVDYGGYHIRDFEFIAKGQEREDAGIEQAELTRPQIIIDDNGRTTTKSNRDACCISYEEGNIKYRTEAYGTTNAKVTLYEEEEGGVTGEADRVVCYEEYHKNGKPFSRTSASGIPTTHATLSMTGKYKIEGKGGDGMLHQRFFDNGVLGTHAVLSGNAKLTVEDSGAIKGKTNTQAQYTKWNKEGDVLNNEVVQGNVDLHIAPKGDGAIRKIESDLGVIMEI